MIDPEGASRPVCPRHRAAAPMSTHAPQTLASTPPPGPPQAGHAVRWAVALLMGGVGALSLVVEPLVPALTVSGTVWAAALVGLGARLGPVVTRNAGWVTPPVVGAAVLVVVLRTRRGHPTRSSNSPALAPCTNAEISAGV